MLAAANVQPGDRVLDLGCGTRDNAFGRMLPGLEVLATPTENLSLPARSVDLVVSSYALHHLRDADKERRALSLTVG